VKLEIREDSSNYACTVVKLPPKQVVPGLDKLVKVTVFGNDVLTRKEADENKLYLFFPVECAISAEYLSKNNEFRETTLNKDQSKSGYFDPSGRVKAIKFKGVISTGYLAPLDTLLPLCDINGFKEGDEFTTINGNNLCKKYVVKHIHPQGNGGGESRHNKKLKRFNKLVPNQFRFHSDTAHLSRNLHMFNPDDIIVITDKWHGTSAVFSNVLIRKELTLAERFVKWLGFDLVTLRYDRLYSSRSVVKNQYINKEAGLGFYGEDIWAIVNKELEDKIEQGITIYGEIVGYLPSGKAIQKGYDYGCDQQNIRDYPWPTDGKPTSLRGLITVNEHKFLVYRITYTKPNGEVIEYSWNMIKEYCKKYSLEHVKEVFFGTAKQFTWDRRHKDNLELWRDQFYVDLSTFYNMEKDCQHCKNKVPAEGVCVRIDGKSTYSTYKLKAKRFLEKETKSLDAGEISIEDEQPVEENA
jgi:hypothetical protein